MLRSHGRNAREDQSLTLEYNPLTTGACHIRLLEFHRPRPMRILLGWFPIFGVGFVLFTPSYQGGGPAKVQQTPLASFSINGRIFFDPSGRGFQQIALSSLWSGPSGYSPQNTPPLPETTHRLRTGFLQAVPTLRFG